MRDLTQQRFIVALAFSLVLHAFALFGIGFVLPDPRKAADFIQPLQVVLVNSKSRTRPTHADALAQHHLDGGGNTPEDRHAQSPLPNLADDQRFIPAPSVQPEQQAAETPPAPLPAAQPEQQAMEKARAAEEAAQRVRQLEEESRRLLVQLKSTHSVTPETASPQPQEDKQTSGASLVQRSLEIARLEAQISKDTDTYQKMPRRTFIGARAQEYRFAQYVEDWRIKVERVGNLNYPEAARQKKVYGSLQLTVSIRTDGSVESVEINRPSGHPILDAAAQRIIKLAMPFAPLPPNIRRDTDILSITRTWTFTQSDRLQSQ